MVIALVVIAMVVSDLVVSALVASVLITAVASVLLAALGDRCVLVQWVMEGLLPAPASVRVCYYVGGTAPAVRANACCNAVSLG